jgi:hypothetical protein
VALLHPEAILSPEGVSKPKHHPLAPRRFKTLDGVRLGLVGNSKLNADAVLLAVSDLLKERYDQASVYLRSKPSFAQPAANELVEDVLAHADVVIAGVGD